MDFSLALRLNRDDLLRVVVGLCALVGLVAVGPMVRCLPRGLRLKVFMALRPAEAAARRLIAVEAQGMSAPAYEKRAAPSGSIPRGAGTGRVPAFPLIDPRRRLDQKPRRRGTGAPPRMFFFDGTDPVIEEEIKASPDDPMNVQRLFARLRALRDAVENPRKHARRLARLLARRARDPRRRLIGPLRPGRPPGHRDKPRHPVDAILKECHALALLAYDTS